MKILTKRILLITVFKNVLKNSVIKSFIDLMNKFENRDLSEILKKYSEFASLLYENTKDRNLYNYLKNLIYTDENILSKNTEADAEIIKTAEYELSVFNELLKRDYDGIKSYLKSEYPENKEILEHLPKFNTNGRKDFDLKDIINSYKKYGYGDFASYSAFNFNENKAIIPVKHFEAMTFAQLKNYEYQKKVIYNNTKAFIEGAEANNILLYGDRGCGKSSTVKALINEFKEQNLKIIQITKNSFVYLNELYEKISSLPLKFIIFADDISFDEDDKNFSQVKSVLEGGLSRRPDNAVIYASANRIHLVKESFKSREGDEIHYNDTIDEMSSLSDRFGIILTFSLLTKPEYIDIVKKIAADYGIEADDKLIKKAEEFAALKGIRTPRTAKQFIIEYNCNAAAK